MADVIQGIRSLPLHDLIGATLVAIVEADAQAARATLDFIETVGFIPPRNEQTGEDNVDAGKLRMADFKYRKLDHNNELAEFTASVPVLSLVPIPSLQVKDAKFKFAAQITDIAQTNKATPAPSAAASTATPAVSRAALATNISRLSIVDRLQPLKYDLVAKPVASSGAKDQEMRGSFHLEVEVTMGQADLPLGLEKLFGMMDQAIRDSQPEQG